MSLILRGLRLPLTHFALTVDVVLSGRVTGLFGPSGAGKTSLLEVIAGLRNPAIGRVQTGGIVLLDVAAKVNLPASRRAIGYVPQDGALFPHIPVKENLLYGFTKDRPYPAGLTFAHIVEVLEIGPLIGRGVETLSGGEKQRVALGRALMAAPRLLLLDEPLAGLDAPLKERLMPYLKRVRDEFAIPMFYVTHSPDEVMALCDEVLMLAEGRVVGHGPPDKYLEITGKPCYRLRS